jgi:hypothetical protein
MRWSDYLSNSDKNELDEILHDDEVQYLIKFLDQHEILKKYITDVVHYVCWFDSPRCLSYLLTCYEINILVNIKNIGYYVDPIYHCLYYGRVDNIRVLLKYGVILNNDELIRTWTLLCYGHILTNIIKLYKCFALLIRYGMIIYHRCYISSLMNSYLPEV